MTETPMVDRDPLDLLAEALAAFQADMPAVRKGKTATVRTRDGGQYQYTYADLADLSAAVYPALSKHGLSFACLPDAESQQLTAILLHTSGQRLAASLPIRGATPQEIGSSLTYARRYLFGAMTGVVTEDDDDGQAAERAARRRPEPPPVAPHVPRERAGRPVQTTDILATEDNPAPDGSVDVPIPGADERAAPNIMRAFHAAWSEAFPDDQSREDRLGILARIIGRDVASSSDMTRTETLQALGFLERIKVGAAGVVRRGGQWVAVAYDEPPEP